MAQAINRKNFLKLTITFTALGSAAGCGDDDDVANPGDPKQPPAGRGGNAGAGAGTNGGGTDSGGTSAGKPGGGTDTGGNTTAGAQTDGGAPVSGQAGDGNDAGGAGGTRAEGGAPNTGGAGGETADPGQGGQGNAGQSGSGGEGGAGTCGGATFVQTAGPGHDHIPADPATMFASFTALVDGSNPTATFALPIENAHSHNIVLTARQVALLRGGGQVVGKMSSLTNGHRHTYTISCG